MSDLKFKRTIEDFICEHCKEKITGNGYTDHCPKCLWSKHVDVNPGDRNANCGGLMRPIGLEGSLNNWQINYLCEKCGYEHKVRTVPEDNFEEILKISN